MKMRRRTAGILVNGPELRRLRMLRGLEMNDLALRVGISRPYLVKIETGEGDKVRRVSVTVFHNLLRTLEVKPRERNRLILDTAQEKVPAA